jgi:ABC-type transport system involved in cytochrome c biogenesis permease subunit
MGSLLSWDPKETGIDHMVVFAIYLHSRLLKRLARAKAAALGSCGFFVI